MVGPDVLLKKDTEGKQVIDSQLQHAVSLPFCFDYVELFKTLCDIQEGDFVSVASSNHTVFLSKKNGVFQFYPDISLLSRSFEYKTPTQLILKLLDAFRMDPNSSHHFLLDFEILRKSETLFPVPGGVDTIRNYLNERGNLDINMADQQGVTALIMAIHVDNESVVELLLDRRADPNLPDTVGITPLGYAIQSGNNKVLQTLLEYKADVNCVTNVGNTLVHLAASNDNIHAIKILAEKGVDLNRANLEGK